MGEAVRKVEKKIVAQEVVKKDIAAEKTKGQESGKTVNPPVDAVSPQAVKVAEPELLQRAESLAGSTYKIKTPLSDHALYVTINNIEVNGVIRPFEIFINSKDMGPFQWIVSLTRVLSAVFRHGGDVAFLVEELQSVVDPKGGYFKPGGRYMPSLVAEIGMVLQAHLQKIGAMEPLEKLEIAEKKLTSIATGNDAGGQCPKCSQFALHKLDGCDTCLECGYAKCG